MQGSRHHEGKEKCSIIAKAALFLEGLLVLISTFSVSLNLLRKCYKYMTKMYPAREQDTSPQWYLFDTDGDIHTPTPSSEGTKVHPELIRGISSKNAIWPIETVQRENYPQTTGEQDSHYVEHISPQGHLANPECSCTVLRGDFHPLSSPLKLRACLCLCSSSCLPWEAGPRRDL